MINYCVDIKYVVIAYSFLQAGIFKGTRTIYIFVMSNLSGAIPLFILMVLWSPPIRH